MKKLLYRKLNVVSAAIIMTGLLGWANSASAVPFEITSCDTSNVTTSTRCDWVNGANDSAATPILGGGWTFLEKDEEGVANEVIDIGLTVNPDGGWASDSGSWGIDDNAWDLYGQLMIVLKAGHGYVGYELKNGVTGGNWSTADINNKDLSHLSIYGKGDMAPVPEPATMLLFGTGLAGLGGSRLRRKKKA